MSFINKRNTRQKEVICEYVKSSCKHPTAEDVYNGISISIPNISLTTVYRNLNQLAEQNYIKKITIPNKPDRFDKNVDNHYHMTCLKCNFFFDLHQIEYNVKYDNIIKEECLILEHDIVFKGICSKCLKNT